MPCYDPISHLAYAAGREHVTDAWVAGERRLQEGRLTTIDIETLAHDVKHWRERLAPRTT
jgi:5-methylthioadenosine/S-adenosylhomocysteine deaminase